MKVESTIKTKETSQFIAFAAGCFWGVENIFRKHFEVPSSILDIRVGYANGNENVINPTYKQVCTGETDFAEVVLISYEPSQISDEKLIDFFFRIHDPTTLNSQGRNVGTQYRSAVFTTNDEQYEIAKAVKTRMQNEWYKDKTISTVIEGLNTFYDAETYHQLYLEKNTDGYACPNHYLREKPE